MKSFLRDLFEGFKMIYVRPLILLYHALMIGYLEVKIWLVAFVYGIDKEQVAYLKKLGARRAEWKWAQKGEHEPS